MPLRPCFSLICAEETFSFLPAWSLYGLWVLSPTVFSPQRHFPMMVVALKVLSFSLSATEIVGGSSGRNGDTGIGYRRGQTYHRPGDPFSRRPFGRQCTPQPRWLVAQVAEECVGTVHAWSGTSPSQRFAQPTSSGGGNVCRSCVLLTMKTSHHRSGDKSRWPR